MGMGKETSAGCDRSGKRSEWSWDKSEGRCDGAVEKPVRSVVTGYIVSEGGQISVRCVVQVVGAIMMAGRGGRAERAIGGETNHSGSTSKSDQKVEVEGSTMERVGIKRNNRIEIA